MKQLTSWLKQNTWLKLLSLLVAFVIWLTVVNFSNPDTRGSQVIPLTVENADKLTSAEKIYNLDTKTVRVSYTVRTKYRNMVTPSDFNVYVDLDDYSITGAVPVYVKTSDRLSGIISDVTPSPIVVHVATEDLQRKRFDVGISTKGSAAEGYIAADAQLASGSDYVWISGPMSEIGQISKVGIEVNVEEASRSITGDDGVLKFYDANDNEITMDDRITLSRTAFSYTVPIYRIKSLSVSAGTVGEPADGYALDGIETSPAFVQVYGPDSALNANVSIVIPDSEVSIAGASKNVTRAIDVTPYLPDGLSLAQPGSEITVVAQIRKLPETSAPPQTESGRTDGSESGTADAAAGSETSEESGSGTVHDPTQHETTQRETTAEEIKEGGLSETSRSGEMQ